jgi:hypothetical protein
VTQLTVAGPDMIGSCDVYARERRDAPRANRHGPRGVSRDSAALTEGRTREVAPGVVARRALGPYPPPRPRAPGSEPTSDRRCLGL